MTQRVQVWVRTHARFLSYVAGSLFITNWTILRFFTGRTIFDLVGQQVLAGQWLHGTIAGSGIGVTNYISKLVFLYMPLHVLPGSPRLKLLLLTIAVNVATLILLGLLIERIAKLFNLKVGTTLYASLLWLSLIAGSVFWIHFTNSRNLEVVGGVFLIYQSLHYVLQPTKQRLVAISAFSVLLFFADSLQIYMTAVPLILYAFVVYRKKQWRRVVYLGVAFAIGVIGSKLLFWLFTNIFDIHFLVAGSMDAQLGQGIVGSVKAVIHLYAGGNDAGKLREIINLLVFTLIVGGVCFAAWRKQIPRKVIAFIGIFLCLNGIVYILSGQAARVSTERYLIMTVPIMMLACVSLQPLYQKFRKTALLIILIFIVINGFFLFKATARSDHHFTQDAHLASVARYASVHSHTLLYGSMDTAIPLAYLQGSDKKAPLPLGCTNATLYKSTTFYSKSAYVNREASAYTTYAVILDGQYIANNPAVCDVNAIVKQLGVPANTGRTDDDSIVLVYNRPLRSVSY